LVRSPKVLYRISIIKMLIRIFYFMLTSCNSISIRTVILIKVATSTTLIFKIHSELKTRIWNLYLIYTFP
jgi:hypothetical protein